MNTVHVGSSLLLAAACALMVAAGNVGSKAQAGPDGEQLYAKYCASCHDQGPVVVGGMMFVNSGYPRFGGAAGNVLLAFGIDE
jgi:cytochrome c5